MQHLVEFETWCPKCLHAKTKETDDPCNSCLNEPVNDDSRKPVFFKEDETKANDSRKEKK